MFGSNRLRIGGWRPRVAVIGAGFSGVLAGIELRRLGLNTFKIFEKASAIGGTWRDNRYPGVACDVPSHLYRYSFESNPDWTHRYSDGAQICRYIERTARKYRIDRHVQFNTEIASAAWTGSEWRMETTAGEVIHADVVITAVGRLHHPSMPAIPGLETFAGPVHHSARWDGAFDPRGKRIGLIGTGSSGAQITAALSNAAARLTVFQRTPHWVLRVPNEPMPLSTRLVLRLPFAAKIYYDRLQREFAKNTSAVRTGRRGSLEKLALKHLDRISDPELRRKMTPDYPPGCKRIIASPDFHDAVQRPNVEVVTDAIDHIGAAGVVTAGGRTIELDAIVLATGFKAGAFLRPMRLTGLGGVTLDELWRDIDLNYRSVALPHMPNFFMINGPYSPGGTVPIIAIAEVDARYIMQCVRHIANHRVALAPRVEPSRAWLDDVRARASETVWVTGGCNSWYLGPDGVPIVNPAGLEELSEDLAALDLADYEVISIGDEVAAPTRAAA